MTVALDYSLHSIPMHPNDPAPDLIKQALAKETTHFICDNLPTKSYISFPHGNYFVSCRPPFEFIIATETHVHALYLRMSYFGVSFCNIYI